MSGYPGIPLPILACREEIPDQATFQQKMGDVLPDWRYESLEVLFKQVLFNWLEVVINCHRYMSGAHSGNVRSICQATFFLLPIERGVICITQRLDKF